ncbi:hypothetical protein FOMPIDRAFT_1024449 [Fomitopsis schrenkii]|uniref:Uncharacterized protein n=1 Tax=Fomitopsis schrenkii TaxID=2126942 RepID=S8E664_FOMSC|nr:hypothetical protein FOMPIDRAFT_1024449 [Fomitopsis schrenkii]
MSAHPTQLAALGAPSSSSSNKFPVPADAYIPWTPAPAPIDLHLAADAKGRQTKFVESTAQRRQRVEFLRRREWTRRIAEWIDSAAAGSSSSSAEAKALAPITYSWVDILAAADADDDYEDPPAFAPSAPSPAAPCPSPSAYPHPAAYPYTPDEQDDEPYIIYTASPRSRTSLPPPHTPPALAPAYPARPPALHCQPLPPTAARRRSGPSPRSRHSSLSSISEEEEEVPVPAPCF